jgi:hypothetical protein
MGFMLVNVLGLLLESWFGSVLENHRLMIRLLLVWLAGVEEPVRNSVAF